MKNQLKNNWLKFKRLMSKYITTIDLGTTSQRVVIYDENLKHIASHQLEYKQISLHPG